MNRELRRRYGWFRRQGVGGIVGQDARICLDLARAELAMREAGVEWWTEPDPEPWDGDCEAPAYVLGVVVGVPCPEHGHDCRHAGIVGSIWSVGVNDPGDPYLRILAAEIYSERLHELAAEGGAR